MVKKSTSNYLPHKSPMFRLFERFEEMRLAYEAGNPAAIYDAFQLFKRLEFEPEGDHECSEWPSYYEWIMDGVTQVLEDRLRRAVPHGRGRTGNESAYYRERMKEYYRFDAVSHFRVEQKQTLADARASAHEVLKGSFAQASPGTMESCYKKVRKALKDPSKKSAYYLANYQTRETLKLT